MPIDQHTYDRLKGLWIEAGGDPGRSDVAAAIAFAESSGCQYALAGPKDIRPVNECAWHVTNGENSCGYWQINLRAHPGYKAPGIFDAVTNATAAVTISENGRSFAAWSTYTNGAYLTYLKQFGGQAPEPPQGFGTGGDEAPPPAPGQQTWASGWQHVTTALARRLPHALHDGQRYREASLRKIAHARRVR